MSESDMLQLSSSAHSHSEALLVQDESGTITVTDDLPLQYRASFHRKTVDITPDYEQ